MCSRLGPCAAALGSEQVTDFATQLSMPSMMTVHAAVAEARERAAQLQAALTAARAADEQLATANRHTQLEVGAAPASRSP
jgi:hypothetical protein